MRRRLLATVAAVVLLYAAARPAEAAFGIGDIVFDPSVFAQVQQEAKDGLEQIKWLTDIYGDTEKSLQELYNFYNLFAHITNVTQLAQILNTQFLNSPTLTDALQLEQAFSGFGLHTSLASKIQTIVQQARYYAPSNNDFTGFQMNQRVTATAGQMATAQDAYTASTQRMLGLSQLMNGVNTADPKAVLDLTARASIETAKAETLATQLQAARIMQEANADTMRQQIEQAQRYSVDQMRNQSQAAVVAANSGAVNLITP